MSGGAELVLPPEEVRLHTAAQFNPSNLESCERAWNTSLRLIENDRPDYRT
jgi:hypothetical protein